MNFLNLISSWIDINCQITMKCVTILKPKFFHELASDFHDLSRRHERVATRSSNPFVGSFPTIREHSVKRTELGLGWHGRSQLDSWVFPGIPNKFDNTLDIYQLHICIYILYYIKETLSISSSELHPNARHSPLCKRKFRYSWMLTCWLASYPFSWLLKLCTPITRAWSAAAHDNRTYGL